MFCHKFDKFARLVNQLTKELRINLFIVLLNDAELTPLSFPDISGADDVQLEDHDGTSTPVVTSFSCPLPGTPVGCTYDTGSLCPSSKVVQIHCLRSKLCFYGDSLTHSSNVCNSLLSLEKIFLCTEKA